MQKNSFRAKGLTFCIAKNEKNECIGYGYIDFKNKNVYYLDTIGVHHEYRRQGIGRKIKVSLIRKAFENPQIDCIKAITQTDNVSTIRIIEELGSKTIETNRTEN